MQNAWLIPSVKHQYPDASDRFALEVPIVTSEVRQSAISSAQ